MSDATRVVPDMNLDARMNAGLARSRFETHCGGLFRKIIPG
jgi:hypothetical protein